MAEPLVQCQPWVTDISACCPDEQFTDECDDAATPVDALYPFSDADYIQMASNILFKRTCRRFPGVCPRTVWPCLRCRECIHCCCAREVIELDSDYPIVRVTEIKIEGVVLDPAAYRVDDWDQLVRTDGEYWPTCTSLREESKAFEITYETGRTPPIELQNAAVLLACELKKACNGRAGCKIDSRIQNLTRTGVTVRNKDIEDYLSTGLTGIPEADLAISQYDCSRRGLRMRHPVFDRAGWIQPNTGG